MRGVTIIRGLTAVVVDSTTVPIIAMFVVSAFARRFERLGFFVGPISCCVGRKFS